MTALMYACENGFVEVIQELLESGADVNIYSDGKGGRQSALFCYLCRGLFTDKSHAPQIIKMLIDKGATCQEEGSKLYKFAFSSEVTWLFKLLINRGVAPDPEAILLACQTCASPDICCDYIRELIKCNVDPFARNDAGYSPIAICCM
jgi:ankyrin repeat protein